MKESGGLMTEKEEWRVCGGSYEVSNYGRVRSIDREVIYNSSVRKPAAHKYKGKLLKPCKDSYGYLVVRVDKKIQKVHRLVATAFIPNPNNKPQINHIDGDKTNNRADNLEWCTSSENIIHAYKNGMKEKSRKQARELADKNRKQVGMRKRVCIDQFTMSGEYVKTYPAIFIAAKDNGISSTEIIRVAQGKKKQTAGYIWRYTERTQE